MTTEQEVLKQQREDILWQMSTMQGRRLMWRLISACGVYQELAGENIQQMMKQEGKRSIGLFLMGITADASQELVFTMMREAEAKAIEEQIKHDNSSKSTTEPDAGGYAATPEDGNYFTDFIGNSAATFDDFGLA